MKRIKQFILPLVLLSSLLAACTKDFDEINLDPNRPKEIFPGTILGQMQYRFINTSISGARSFTHEVMQVTAPRASRDNGLHRYHVTEDAGSSLWNNIYSNMTDAEDLYVISDRLNENNYKAISLIFKSWGYSLLTDAFGDVPYTQATQATNGIFNPVFERQQDIYPQLLRDLEQANNLLDDTKILGFGGDLIYNATTLSGGRSVGIQRWKKLCNSLRLRLLLRISKRDGEVNVTEQINAILADPVKYPVFTSTADDAILRYPGTYPYFNPYYNARTLDWREGTYYTEFFINYLNAVEDPRRAVWATQVRVGNSDVYQGIQSGYESSVEYIVNRNSSYHDGLKTLPQLGIMMTYAELEFMKAELALKGFSTGKSPKAHYESGVAASMAQWGVSMPTGFLQKDGVQYDATASQNDQLAQIMLQKYYALYFTDYQAWFEKRRTGLPVLPRGAGIPENNQFPTRFFYPTYLQSLNPERLNQAVSAMGGNTSTIKVWWEK